LLRSTSAPNATLTESAQHDGRWEALPGKACLPISQKSGALLSLQLIQNANLAWTITKTFTLGRQKPAILLFHADKTSTVGFVRLHAELT
jgi:hypothetical protein